MEFVAFPKLPRLLKGEWVITEKLDGTNAGVQIEAEPVTAWPTQEERDSAIQIDGSWYRVQAQSRNRLIFPGDDNYGFAAWVKANAEGLVRALGIGVHFGEWWGQGIQRRYGLDQRLFSLFNVGRWGETLNPMEDATGVPGLRAVPLLATIGAHDLESFRHVTYDLETQGSYAAPGCMNPEGVVVFDTRTRALGKWTFEGDEPKWTKQS